MFRLHANLFIGFVRVWGPWLAHEKRPGTHGGVLVGNLGIFWPAEHISSLVLMDGDRPVALSDVVGNADAVTVPAMLVNHVLCDFVLAKKWRTILFLARWWDNMWAWDWPPRWWRDSTRDRTWEPDPDAAMGAQETAALIRDLRLFAPKLLEGFS